MRRLKGAEHLIETLFQRSGAPILQPYRGYAEPGHLVLQGRVLSAVRRDAPDPDQSRWTNFKEMASLFFTSEVADVSVVAEDGIAQSNAEGYVTLRLPRPEQAQGWVTVDAELTDAPETRVPMPALVPHPEARFGVISDIDDTMMMTGAHSLARNLWTTFTGNALTRQIFPDSKTLMDRLSDHARNPVYYVSSSPWNLHSFLDKVFTRADLVAGPMFLRDLGISEDSVVGASHQDHKGAAVDTILAANPELTFFLLGDTGQKDAQVYRDAVKRHPDRIQAVLLREPVARSKRAALEALLEIEAMGVPTYHGRNFSDLPDRVLPGVAEAQQ
ncbi:phosphatase domain-containing protein [Marivita hallyeonensis]|uniref:Phosphatidate phosphatase APP1 n=1 Tax=Marivita hallyeonensis TaxID=996342 RepID=A0A1M5M645_9RHOB|nr:phosphatase domain-containing protein [Marivita hallyeonensis]SHG72736.1 Phosphatidate phosphatase APP1 [Marivita hallyeonensis]